LSDVAKAAFDEYPLTLLLHQHPPNYSDEIAQTEPGAVPRLVRRAERFMMDNAETPITVSDVAAELGISVRSLQAGFHQWRSMTPMAFLRSVRLQRARDDLLRSEGEIDEAGGAHSAACAEHGASS
jgi:transcriptional regulator GlxA family with amidase domain